MKPYKINIWTPFILLVLILRSAASLGMEVGDKAPPISGNSTQGVIVSADIIDKPIYNMAIREGNSNPHHGTGLIHPKMSTVVTSWLKEH